MQLRVHVQRPDDGWEQGLGRKRATEMWIAPRISRFLMVFCPGRAQSDLGNHTVPPPPISRHGRHSMVHSLNELPQG